MSALSRRVVGLCFVTLAVSIIAFCQDSNHTIPRSSLPPAGNLLSLVRWRVEGKQGHLLCVISEERANKGGASLPTRVLNIYREDGDRLIEMYEFESPDSPLNTYPLGEYNARLFVTWVGGSAYHLRVLAFVDGRVRQVLDEGSKLSPEFLYDEQDRESVLITEPTFENGKWTATNGMTKVFKWNGQSYDKLGTVPWAKRLQCLSKQACASLK
jgi:hypothetical protein